MSLVPGEQSPTPLAPNSTQVWFSRGISGEQTLNAISWFPACSSLIAPAGVPGAPGGSWHSLVKGPWALSWTSFELRLCAERKTQNWGFSLHFSFIKGLGMALPKVGGGDLAAVSGHSISSC